MSVHINWTKPRSHKKSGAKFKWCFGCRKYSLHWIMEFFQEWYGWNFYFKCDLCGEDRTRFGE